VTADWGYLWVESAHSAKSPSHLRAVIVGFSRLIFWLPVLLHLLLSLTFPWSIDDAGYFMIWLDCLASIERCIHFDNLLIRIPASCAIDVLRVWEPKIRPMMGTKFCAQSCCLLRMRASNQTKHLVLSPLALRSFFEDIIFFGSM
jgi:hypothetical protein